MVVVLGDLIRFKCWNYLTRPKENEVKVTLELVIETDEAEAEELAMAVKTALNILEMPNGDSLYLGDQIVVVKDVSA